MKKIMIFLVLISCTLMAEQKYFTISGEIEVENREGSVYVSVFTKTDYNSFHGSQPSIQEKFDLQGQVKIPFEIKGISKGNYVITFYQDINSNEKWDKFLMLPKEPWNMLNLEEKKFGKPKFEEVKQEVNKDIIDVLIKVY